VTVEPHPKWTYHISTGDLTRYVATGYSGWDDGDGIAEPGEGKNDPAAQDERGIGPIPAGRYSISPLFTHPTAGPYTMRLTALPGTETFGRSGFLIHGDSLRRPGTASHGCIILPRAVRIEIANSGLTELEVVPT